MFVSCDKLNGSQAFCLLLIFAFGVVGTWKELWLLYREEISIKLKGLCPWEFIHFFSCKYSYLFLVDKKFMGKKMYNIKDQISL